MNGLLAGSLSVSLWLCAVDQPNDTAPAPAVTLGKPVVSLGKPIPESANDTRPSIALEANRQVQPVSFTPSDGDAIVRGQSTDVPLTMPRSLAIDNSAFPSLEPSFDARAMPRASALQPVPAAPGSMPATGQGPIVNGQVIPGPIATGPMMAGPGIAGPAASGSMFYGPGIMEPGMAGPAMSGPVMVGSAGPGTVMSGPIIMDGDEMMPGAAVGAICDEDGCPPCEESRWRRLALFTGGCTDWGNPPSRFWASAEYLLWNIKNPRIPPLVTTSPPGTPQAAAGVLPNAATLYPPDNGSVFDGLRSGGRFTLGWWFCRDQCIGIESTFFFLGDRSTSFDESSAGTPILARPYFSVPGSIGSGLFGTAGPSSELVAYPGVVAGAINVHTDTQLWGADLNLRTNLARTCCCRVDLIGGFRFLKLDDSLGVREDLNALGGAGPVPIVVEDGFRTRNDFYGGQVGIDVGLKRGRWSLDLLGKIAVGDMNEQVQINGGTALPTMGIASPTGILALPSNIGSFDRNRLAFVPEAGLKLGFQCSQHCQVFVGYTFMYLSDVVRAGDQIDTRVNINQVFPLNGTGSFPAVTFKRSDFWAQGINFGVQFRF